MKSQTVFQTGIFDSRLKTLEIGIEGQPYSLPLLELNDEEHLTIEFDELSHDQKVYSYTIQHCNADWRESDLSSNEFLDGFTTGEITNSEISLNTTTLYTHYRFDFPNDEMKLKVSGNYVLTIFEDNKKDIPVARACFSVVDPEVQIKAAIRSNTDLEINGRLQQLDFELMNPGYKIDNPEELKILVRQNYRTDNQVFLSKPTYINPGSFSYKNIRELIFEGGNEFRRFDFSSYYSANESIRELVNQDGIKNVYVSTDFPFKGAYQHRPDADGNFIINFQEAFENGDTEADYARVHLQLKSKIYFEGQLYLGGEFMYENLNENSRMEYNPETESYEKTLFLKQGGYAYQYRFLEKGSTKASTFRTENSYWQTNNAYQIYVYHRPWGGRADKLIGFANISNQ